MDAEEALRSLGKWSRWQMCMISLTGLGGFFMTCLQTLSIVFIGLEPEHRCAIPPEALLNGSIPHQVLNGVTKYSKCLKYAVNTSDNHGNATVDCEGEWYYGLEPGQTIASEWDLVCDQSFLVELSQIIMLCGVGTGATLCSYLSDKFGRKAVCVPSIIVLSLLGIGMSFTQNYTAFVIIKFFIGVAQQLSVLSFFVLGLEVFPAMQRTVPALLVQNMWALGMMALALLAYFIRNWRHLQLVISVPGLLCIAYFWVLNESIPWMVARGRLNEARISLQKAAKFNSISLPAKFLPRSENERPMLTSNDHVINEENNDGIIKVFRSRERSGTRITNILKSFTEKPQSERDKEISIMDLLRSPKLRMYTLIMCYSWTCSAFIYFGLSLSTASLSGNIYLNFFLSGLVEIPSYFITAFLLSVWGRRYSICMLYVTAGVSLFIYPFIPETIGGCNMTPLIVTLVMIGKSAISGAFSGIFLYAPEIFPTTARNTGIGMSSVTGRLGNILSPFSMYVAKVIPWLPGVVFGVMGILAGLLTLLLPETLGRPLPQTIADIENWTRALTKEEKAKIRQMKK